MAEFRLTLKDLSGNTLLRNSKNSYRMHFVQGLIFITIGSFNLFSECKEIGFL